MDLNEPITEEWLKSVGFRWDEWERSGGKHWTLWCGGLGDERAFASFEDLGVELAVCVNPAWGWSCWLRSDCSHKYARFIHIRHMKVRGDVIRLVVALTDQDWNPANHLYGSVRTQKEAEYIRATEDRLDRRVMKTNTWKKHERDDSAERPNVEPHESR